MKKTIKSNFLKIFFAFIAFFGVASAINAAQITYHGNGGTPETYSTNNNLPLNVSLPVASLNPNIAKEGYSFEGWYDHEQWTLGNKIERFTFTNSGQHLNLYARWELEYYNIEYNLDGGVVDGENPTTYHYKDNPTLIINPTKEGYTFTGWTGTGLDAPTTQLSIRDDWTGDKSFTANWEVINYNITYNLNGGNAQNPDSYNIESDDITLNNPTKDGYEFTGWTGSNGDTEEVSVTIPNGSTGDKNYVANFEPINYSITYELNGGSAQNPDTYNIESNDITLNNPTKDGYEFTGWTGSNGSAEETNVTIPNGSTGDKNFIANWKKIVKLIIKYLDNADNEIADQESTEYLEGDSYTATEPKEINGYVLNEDKMPTTEGTFETDDVTIKYYYNKLLNLVFEENGGSEVEDESNVVEGTVIDLSKYTTTKEGYTFDGWYKDADLTEKFEDGSELLENTTLYAKWIEDKKEETKKEDKIIPNTIDKNIPQTNVNNQYITWIILTILSIITISVYNILNYKKDVLNN